jgi:pimeloyl-ACP methyl ester carboxylesterase
MKAAAATGLVIAALAATALAQAQPAPANGAATGAPLDAAARQAVVTQLTTALRERYVFPVVGAKAAEVVSANLRSGAYDTLTDPAQFAVRLERDLFAIAHDEHLRVITPSSRLSGLPPPRASLPPAPPSSEVGVVRADRLRGGIGYIEITQFPPLAAFRPVIDRAMSALQGSKALVIDDRRNQGGDPASVDYLVSFLTPVGRPVHINDVIARQAGTQTFTRQTYYSQPTPVSFAGLPVYVLTSNMTFSGGEEFAYDLQTLKLATVVGDVTSGGANPTGPVRLGAGLTALVPWGRAENPITKTNWEGRGVHPDIEVPWSDALATTLSRLGQSRASDVTQVSEKQVFTPRTTPTPGSEAALRRLLETVASGAPDYAIMTPQFAEVVRTQLPQVQALLAKLGPVKSVRFYEFDGTNDVFDVTYTANTWRFTVMLTADGKLTGSAILGPVTGSGPTAQQSPPPSAPDPTLAPYASTKDSVRLPDGRTIHMVCMGRGSPVVILTPGGNDLILVWNKVQPAVAEKTRVCSWERAGAGLSSPSPKPQTVSETTTDLQAALKAGNFTGPYVMVGHSRGAGESLLLKDREPSNVVGMVLIDPAVPGWRAERDRVAPAISEWERANPDPAYAFLKKCAAAMRAGTVRRGGPDPDGCLPAARFPPSFPPELRVAFEKHFAELTPAETAAGMDIAAAQLDTDFAELDSRASVNADRNYGSMPLIVLTAGDSTPPPANLNLPVAVTEGLTSSDAELRRDHDALAALSTRGVNRTVAGSTHMIPQIKPQVVIDAIDEVVDEARASVAIKLAQ